jgi:hypothetical protein
MKGTKGAPGFANIGEIDNPVKYKAYLPPREKRPSFSYPQPGQDRGDPMQKADASSEVFDVPDIFFLSGFYP